MSFPSPYLEQLSDKYIQYADPTRASEMEKYMRNQFSFYGIKKPLRATLTEPIIKELFDTASNHAEIAICCWQQPQREWQYFGIEFMAKSRKYWNENTPANFEYLITQKSWWDTVDFIAVHCVGKYFTVHPGERNQWIEKWRYSDNFWLVRVAILFQLQYKEKTDVPLLFDICSEHAWQKEFFIRKAIGWSLRQYARTNPGAVQDFVKNSELSALSKREALKHFN